MGYRTGAFAKVWEITPVSDTATKLRMTISRKNKTTGEYEDDFSGFVYAAGTAAAAKAARLKKGDRIKLGDVDVTTRYDRGKNITYTNYKLFSFDPAENSNAPSSGEPQPDVDGGEPTAKPSGRRLPF